MTLVNKKYQVKIFEKDGQTLIETINPIEIKSDIKFKSSINSGLGELSIILNRKFDDYDEGNSINILNIIKVFHYDKFDINSLLIYSGFISQYTPFANESFEGVKITILGLVSLLQFSKYRQSGNLVFNRPLEDPSVTMQSIIDNASVDYPNLFSTNIETVGVNTLSNFDKIDHLGAINQVFNQTGGEYYWYIDELGVFNFKLKPTSATHIFTIGKDVEKISTEKSSEELINDVTLFYGANLDIILRKQDNDSINKYGRHEKVFSDSKIIDPVTAGQFVDQKILDNKDLKIKSVITINNNFHFDEIKVGDTCKVVNIKDTDTTLSNNMQIIAISYSPNTMTLQIDDFRLSFGKEMQRFIS